ncbi:MAG: D-alanine-D-alanine ligase, partial [uncultured bacterium]
MSAMKKNINVGVFFGSRSPEHDVSIITGQLIISELKKIGYEVTPVYLSKEGKWYINPKLGTLKFFTNPEKENELKKLNSWQLELSASSGKMTFKSDGLIQKKVMIDLAFPAFHGANGEDGTIQGLFELINVPYVGCDVLSSALSMDKAATKLIYRSEGIQTTNFLYFNRADWDVKRDDLMSSVNDLRWPVFVKPARLGSSIGITKVKDKNELKNACEVALHYDDKVIIEESVENMSDITCAVIGNENRIPSLVQEAVFSGDHFNYEDKYLEDGGAQLGNAKNSLVIPANISDEKTKEVQELAVKIYKIFGCSGIARIDFLYEKFTQKVFANE